MILAQNLFSGLFFLAANTAATNTAKEVAAQAVPLAGNAWFIIIGIIFIIVAFAIFSLVKKLIINSILGLIAWAIVVFAFKLSIPFWPSLILSALFGLAGLGSILVLAVLGIV